MQLYILDKNPIISAQMIPDKYKFKMLIELGQLICSAGLSNVYKPIKQGKELQDWVKEHKIWAYKYHLELLRWSIKHINMEIQTKIRLACIRWDLFDSCYNKDELKPISAYFRYAKEYKCNIPSKTLLPIEQCIAEYKKYLTEFKGCELCQ